MTTSVPNTNDAAQALNTVFQENADRPSENRLEMKYEELRLTEDDGRNIDQMVSLLASDNIILVGINTPKIQEAGRAIWGVHAFRLLEHTITSEDLKSKMQTIFNYSTYWLSFLSIIKTQFLGGLVRCFEGNKEVTSKHLPDFAKAIGKEDRTADLQAIVKQAKTPEDWDSFFRIILDL